MSRRSVEIIITMVQKRLTLQRIPNPIQFNSIGIQMRQKKTPAKGYISMRKIIWSTDIPNNANPKRKKKKNTDGVHATHTRTNHRIKDAISSQSIFLFSSFFSIPFSFSFSCLCSVSRQEDILRWCVVLNSPTNIYPLSPRI